MGESSEKQPVFYEFDCPNCDANNPWDDGFKHADEIRCHYCGTEFRVKVYEDSRKYKLREI